jgi:ribosome-binding protein aMBF1 (putative translation factor)
MARRPKTGFDKYFATQMKDAEFKREYERARREIDSVDAVVRALDARREEAGLTKADLARRVGMSPEVVRRLFTARNPNPTLDTVVRLAVALDCNLGLEPRVGRRTRKLAARDVRG